MAVHIIMMALVLVVPIDQENVTVGPVLETDDLRPLVVGQEKVGRMCDPTNPDPLARRVSRLIRAPWMLFMKSEP